VSDGSIPFIAAALLNGLSGSAPLGLGLLIVCLQQANAVWVSGMKKLLLVACAVVALLLVVVPIMRDRGHHAYQSGSYDVALKYWLLLAMAGDGEAQRLVGLLYEYGQGVPQDISRATDWYRKAAKNGDADGQPFLGIMYAKGQGVAQSDEQAVLWFQNAAAQDSAKAYSLLGDMYSWGRGVQKDDQKATDSYRKAVELNSKAAEHGDINAETSLGYAYASSAFPWFESYQAASASL
jgi:hypothetical protein